MLGKWNTTEGVAESVAMTGLQKSPVYRMITLQLTVLLPICLILIAIDSTLAYSAFLGGAVGLVSQGYFAIYAFRYKGARAAYPIARAFYWGETGKFLLTVVGFGTIFLWVKPIHFSALFATYCLMILIQLLAATRIIKSQRDQAR